MKSFDAWDTLIARRSVKDIYNETNNVFPIQESVAKVQPGDLIVSDYYDETGLQQLIPDVTGLSNRVVVTEEGKTKGTIWRLLPEVTEHLDDNANVLAKLPAHIKGVPTDLSNFTKKEESLLPTLPGLAHAMREARLRTWDSNSTHRQLQLVQIEGNFPILYCASLLLHKNLRDETVLMSSRDCYYWLPLLGLIAYITQAKYRVQYFLTSRICRAFPSPGYLGAVNELLTNAIIVDLCGTGWSLSRMLERTSRPNTPILFLVKYDIPSLEREYQAIGAARVPLVNSLVPSINGANLERANLADHAMVIDGSSDGDPVYFNPCNIDWKMPEILVQHAAYGIALNAMTQYPLDLHASEETLRATIQQACEWLKEYDSAFEFASQFLIEEDKAVMARLKEMACAK